MKISTFIGILLVIGGIFFIFAQMISEANTQYSTNISSSEWDTKYDYASSINTSIAPIKSAFDQIEDENLGWFTKITAGIVAIPRAVTALPTLVFGTFSIGGSILTGFFTALSIPAYIILLGTLMLVIWGIFKLVEIYQRWQV